MTTTFQVSKPQLYVIVLRDNDNWIKDFLAFLTALAVFLWLHRYPIVQLIKNVNKTVEWVEYVLEGYVNLCRKIVSYYQFQVLTG